MSDDEEGGTRIGDIYIPPPVKPYCSTESIGPRLIITKISNNNFKSYAGEVVLGPFSNCFHAIIGPNGSGKSNVIDSMLFVFGYRANKIRCKKLSVLIHKSSAHENISSCSVAVHFAQIVDKADGSYDFVPNSAFVISRTAFRDNSSYYTINNRRVHFKEVAKMLKQHGVDLDHNRFLILQGEVESIAMMKPKGASESECGLLEYLEDIVGTTRYKEPLQKINSRVEILTEESTDKHNRCKMAQREMDDLNAPKDQAIDYINMENEKTRAQNLYFQKMVTELKEHDDKYAEINRLRLEKEKMIEDEMKQYGKLLKSKEESEQKVASSMRKVDSINQTMESVNKQRKQYKTQIKKEEEKLIELKKIPAKNASEIAESETKIEKLTAEKTKIEEQLEKNLESLQEQTQPLIEKKEKFQNDLLGYQTKVDECKAALTVSSNELKIVQHSETSERQKYNTWKDSLEESKKDLDEKKAQLKELQSNLPEVKQSAVNYRQQLEDRVKEENELTQQLRRLRAEVDEKNSAMRAARSNNKIVDSLMKLKINGTKGFEGVLGRLGDLGGIDAKYDIAISTCCGRLENIVVDTVDTAQKCIKHLADNRLGRATFIALEKMKPPHPRNQYPENVHRLYDLIRVEDDRVRSAFYFALHETLVADDIDQATRIAYGSTRFRTVTLKGELIEISGSMSGGGRPIKGRMGQQVKTKTSRNDANTSMSADDIGEMNRKVEELSNRISYCQEQQGQLEKDLRNIDVSIKQKETALKRLATEINSLEKSMPEVEEQCEAQRQRMEATKSDPAKVKELQSIVQKNEEALKVSEAEAKKIKDKVSEVEKKIKSITAEKVKSLESKIEDMGKQIAKLSKNVSRLKVEVIMLRQFTLMCRPVARIHIHFITKKKSIFHATIQPPSKNASMAFLLRA
ncbi:hypothetical protein HA402_008979 [Bradysia odoriphaga]|nr:hypothetical protein HA402_008979 [Bradysia odoriphaga]